MKQIAITAEVLTRSHRPGSIRSLISMELHVAEKMQNQESSMKEAQFLAQLASHDMKNINVVRYEESFIDRDRLCIVMELCDGDLDSEIKQHRANSCMYTEDEIMEMFVQILMGLAHIHNNRILHRGVFSPAKHAHHCSSALSV